MIKKVLIAIVVIVVLFLFFKPNTYTLPANLTYYWGDGCPHCKTVADFMSSWDPPIGSPRGEAGEAGKKIQIDKKEVWNNTANAKELKARYEYCKIPQSEMGVPLLFTPEGKCYSGDTPIIDYLKSLN